MPSNKMYNLKEINSTPFIYDTLGKVLDKRSEYLKSLYYSISPRVSIEGTYLDIGAGNTINGKIFGKSFKKVYLLDLNPITLNDCPPNITSIIGDARDLHFKDSSIDLITLISVIEHIPDPQKAISEAERVIKPGGDIVIQLPNKYFPMDLHTGILNPFWLPKALREPYTKLMGFPNYTKEVFSLPTLTELYNLFSTKIFLLDYRKVVYPPNFVPLLIRPIYWILYKLGLLNILPLGHLYVFRKS